MVTVKNIIYSFTIPLCATDCNINNGTSTTCW